MNNRIPRYKSGLYARMQQEKKFVTPTREGTKEELKELQNCINSIIDMLDDEKAKPFSNKYMNVLKDNPYCSVFKKALASVLYDKVKNIVENNKDKFNMNFETYMDNSSISIYTVINNIRLCSIYLDICSDTPTLNSIVYDENIIKNKKDNIDSSIIKYGKDKENLENNLNSEKVLLEEMIKDNHNFIPLTKEEILNNISKYDRSILEQIENGNITPIFIQQNKINKLSKELNNIIALLNERSIDRDNHISMLELIKDVNFEDFILLRELLEKELGIKINEKKYCINTYSSFDKNLIEKRTYDIGNNKYTLKYSRTTKIPK